MCICVSSWLATGQMVKHAAAVALVGRGLGLGRDAGSGGCVKETVCGCSLQQGSPEWAGRGRALGCLTLVLKYGGMADGAREREPPCSGLCLASGKVEHCCLVDDKNPKLTARPKTKY